MSVARRLCADSHVHRGKSTNTRQELINGRYIASEYGLGWANKRLPRRLELQYSEPRTWIRNKP